MYSEEASSESCVMLIKLSYIFNAGLKRTTFKPLNLTLSTDNRPVITERKQKLRNGSCSNPKHNCTSLQPLRGKKN